MSGVGGSGFTPSGSLLVSGKFGEYEFIEEKIAVFLLILWTDNLGRR